MTKHSRAALCAAALLVLAPTALAQSTPPQGAPQGAPPAPPPGQTMHRHGGDGQGMMPHHHHRVMARMMAMHVLPMMDADRSGSVSRAEFDAFRLARFSRADANRNGVLSREEAQAARAAMRAEHRAHMAPPGSPPPGAPPAGAAMRGDRDHGRQGGPRGFARADANNDGRVTRAEYDAASAAAFARMDQNRDGQLNWFDRPQRRTP